MSVTFTADEDNLPLGYVLSDSLSDVLNEWTSYFTGSHTNITGTFSGTADNSWPTLFGTPISGSSYSFGSDADGFKFVATGDLYYYFNATYTPASPTPPDTHTLFGTLDSIALYTDADNDGLADDLFLTIDFSTGITGALADGHDNAIHEAIYGLMEGDATELLTLLGEQGIDVTDSLAELTGSSLAAESELLLAA
ncbi:MAG: heme acquisition protein HasA [Novosphingobium sp.]